MPKEDLVNHPPHYTNGAIEAIEVIMDQFHDDYSLAAAYKYIHRCRHKGKLVQDLKKAIWYLNLRIDIEEQGLDATVAHWTGNEGEDADIRDEVRVCPECGLFHINKPPCGNKKEKVRL
mgnify:FL=1